MKVRMASAIFRGGVGHSLVIDPAAGVAGTQLRGLRHEYKFSERTCEIDTLTRCTGRCASTSS
jgi:hypothetical protein